MIEQIEQAAAKALPAVPFLRLDADGAPYLEGYRCGECGATYLGERNTCSRCFTRDQMAAVRLSERGHLHTFSIVHRSYPGIAVPYVSAVVDLEGGGTLKGNLMGVEPDPEKIAFDMPVKVVFGDALGRKDAEGNAYISYFFAPAND